MLARRKPVVERPTEALAESSAQKRVELLLQPDDVDAGQALLRALEPLGR